MPLLRSSTKHATGCPRPVRTPWRPQLEVLEDRCLLSAGLPDPTFGTNGIAITDVAATGGDWIESLALQTNGKIVVAGNVGVARYNADGSLDTTFNGTGAQPGVVTVSPGAYLNAVAVQADGKVVAAGRTYGTSDDRFLVHRFTTSGAPDSTFGTAGVVATNFQKGKTDEIAAIAIQPWDQKIVAVGYANRTTWAVVRYNSNGSLDTTFNRTGTLTGFGKGSQYAEARAVVVQPDRKLVVVGVATGPNGTGTDFALARYNADGSLDSSFGVGGKVLTDFSSEGQGTGPDEAFDAVLQPDGKIVVIGNSRGSHSFFALARYNPDGSLDTTFADDGKLAIDTPVPDGAVHRFQGVALQPDGKIVAAGGDGLVWVGRFNTNGSLDPSFNDDGWQYFAFDQSGADSRANDVLVQPDGNILVGGGASSPTRFALARLLPSEPQVGSLTSTQSGSSVVLTAAQITDANPNSTILQVAFYLDGALLGEGTQTSPGTWTFSFSTSGLAPGTHTVTVRATDSYGVVSNPLALTLQVSVDGVITRSA